MYIYTHTHIYIYVYIGRCHPAQVPPHAEGRRHARDRAQADSELPLHAGRWVPCEYPCEYPRSTSVVPLKYSCSTPAVPPQYPCSTPAVPLPWRATCTRARARPSVCVSELRSASTHEYHATSRAGRHALRVLRAPLAAEYSRLP